MYNIVIRYLKVNTNDIIYNISIDIFLYKILSYIHM